MSKAIKFLLTTSWILFSRGYDVYATYQHTPDLEKEANPLASILGFGWSPILLIVGLLTLLIIYNYYVATFKPYNLLPQEKGLSFEQVTTYIYFGKSDKWNALLYKMPKNIKRLQHYLGHLLTYAMSFAGIISTIMWLLIRHTNFYKNYHSAATIYAIMILGIIGISIYWHRKMYKTYQLQTEQSYTTI